MALELFSKKFMGWASKTYKGVLATELNKMGLQYEDLLNIDKPVVAEALELADPDILKGRIRRLKRASDLSFKGKLLYDYAPNMKLEPFKEELWHDIEKLESRNAEYALLDLYKN